MNTKQKEHLLNNNSTASAKLPRQARNPYAKFSQINGNHSFRAAVPNGYVDYAVRKRHGGKVAYFNFDLAKEMGLIAADHPHKLTPALSQAILEAFALVIINEWDIENNKQWPKKDIKANRYMATRYLQLQHPCKRGTTSGDGRGIWNGELEHRGVTWDVTSSGTGATCLSPAVAIEGRYFQTGDRQVCYGDGFNTIDSGFITAMMSEIFHQNGIATERTLTLIEFDRGKSINVRAGQNLLRPSHFFNHLKQGNLTALRGAVDYFIKREQQNKKATTRHKSVSRQTHHDAKAFYGDFAIEMAVRFARLAAQFESEYIFCWMDWDGDNVLALGGIIDYGSIRKFGLYHDEYRYDDVDRFSTKISEQRLKARYTVQTIAQIRSYLVSGKKKSIKAFRNDAILKLFDRTFEYWMDHFLLEKIGFNKAQVATLMQEHRRSVTAFRREYAYFERTQSKRGVYKVSDGVTSNAVFCMRDALRELPRYYLSHGLSHLEAAAFIAMMRSKYAKKKDLTLSGYRRQKVKAFHRFYLKLVRAAAASAQQNDLRKMLMVLAMRSAVLNRHDTVTGDGIEHANETLLRFRKKASQAEVQALVEQFIKHQTVSTADDHRRQEAQAAPTTSLVLKLCEKMDDQIKENAEGI